MRKLSRLFPTLVVVSLVSVACGSSDAAERPTITATPTTAAPSTVAPAADPEPSADESESSEPAEEADPAEEEATTGDEAEADTESEGDAETDAETEGDAETEADEAPTTEPPAADAPDNDVIFDIAKAQILGLGYTEEEAECVAGNLDFSDPRVLDIDPEVITPAFEACGADPQAFLDL